MVVRWRHRAYFVRARGGRRRGRGRRQPVRRPQCARRPVQVVRRDVELRARAAQHQPRGAAGRARVRGAAGHRRERGRSSLGRPRATVARAFGARAGRRWSGDRARDREPAGAVDRRLLHQGPDPRREHPAVLDRCHRRPRRATARHPRARDPRLRLRRVPLGPDRRPDHARPHGPSLCRARAGAVGFGRVGRPPERVRPPAAGGCARPVVDRAGGATDERRARSSTAPISRPTATTSPARCRCGGSSPRRRPTASRRRTGYGTSLGPPLRVPQDDEIQLALARRRQGSATGEHLPGGRHAVDRAQCRRVEPGDRLRRR